jgi:aminopeptidase Y
MRLQLSELSIPTLLLLGEVGAVQLPLFQAPKSQVPIAADKELVSSSALQEQVKAENLLKRAKELYKIAELGEEEYNHPTRVIGSEGIHREAAGVIQSVCGR